MKCNPKLEGIKNASDLALHLEGEGIDSPMAVYSMLILVGALIKASGQRDIPEGLVMRTIAIGFDLKETPNEVH